jgi:arginase family enzyme
MSPKSEPPLDWFPWRVAGDPSLIRLTVDKDAMTTRRDRSRDPVREPGLVNPQRYVGGLMPLSGFPTLLGAPLAFTPDDLRAAKVDVALVGLTVDDNPVSGARFAANTMRTLRDWMPYPAGGTDNVTGVDWSTLTMCDYGNIASHANQAERSLEEIHAVISEILDAGSIPVGVGGTHVQSYGFITALAQKYGPKQFALLHIDAHNDTYLHDYGRAVHNGSLFRVAVDLGLIEGPGLVQVGLRGQGQDAEGLRWMRDNSLRSHFQAEVQVRGWDEVLRTVLSELRGRRVYITFDMDGIDPSYARGVGTQDPDGLTGTQAMQLVRAVAIQNEIVAADFMEYNPFMDDVHQTTGVLMDRLIRTLLAGIAARKQGITDPFFVDPRRVDHGVPVP